jgi:hypothetical protein
MKEKSENDIFLEHFRACVEPFYKAKHGKPLTWEPGWAWEALQFVKSALSVNPEPPGLTSEETGIAKRVITKLNDALEELQRVDARCLFEQGWDSQRDALELGRSMISEVILELAVVTDGPSQPAVPNIKPPSECTDEELIQYAVAVVANERQCAPDFLPSTSFLQRRLKWGYARAVLLRDEIIRRVPSLQPTSSTQPTEGRASAEGEKIVLISSSRLDLANSLAAMITEWIEGGIKGGTDWRNHLPTLIARRLERFEVSKCVPNIDTQRVEGKD